MTAIAAGSGSALVLGAERPPCAQCGGPVAPEKRRDARYCDDRCRDNAYKDRQRQAKARDGMPPSTGHASERPRSDTSAAATDDGSPLGPDIASRCCLWCGRPMQASTRRDAVYHCRRCRDASHRFGWGAPTFLTQDEPMRWAYADPPYPGKAGLYRDHADYGGEVDHAQLLERLVDEFRGGWVLSTSSERLAGVLALCPPGVRVHAWTKEVRPDRGLALPRNAWEPVLFYGGRLRPHDAPQVVNYVHCAPQLRAYPGSLIGIKPPAFCWWMFDCIGAQPHDELVDLFVGSGAVSRAWRRWTGQELPEGGQHATGRPGRDPSPARPPAQPSRRSSAYASPVDGHDSSLAGAEVSAGSSAQPSPATRAA